MQFCACVLELKNTMQVFVRMRVHVRLYVCMALMKLKNCFINSLSIKTEERKVEEKKIRKRKISLAKKLNVKPARELVWERATQQASEVIKMQLTFNERYFETLLLALKMIMTFSTAHCCAVCVDYDYYDDGCVPLELLQQTATAPLPPNADVFLFAKLKKNT